MPRLLSLRIFPHAGPALIAMGLGVVLVAQVVPAIPVAVAMMLIGCGATLVLRTSRSQLLSAANLVIYATLVCFTIAAQTHSAVSGPEGRISLLLWVDHLAAILLLATVVMFVVGRLGRPTAFDR